MRARISLNLAAAAVAAILLAVAAAAQEGKPSREALKDLELALKLLNAGQIDQGIERLQALIALRPEDPAAEKARGLLPDFGVGKDVRIVLDERKVFRERLKVPDREVLKVAEETLAAARKLYEGVTPYFTKTSLTARFFHSQERYRKATGLLTSSGHFSISMADYKKKTMEGTLEWHLPGYARTLKDRELSIRGTLCHENAHYLNAIHFARELPQVLEEGIATYVESRLNTEYYQYFRETDRERIEASARNALNAITKYQDFLAMLDAARGFDRGDEMISRWYGLCYAIVDFFEQGEIGGRKGSFLGLLKLLETVVHDRLKAAEKTGKPERREPLAARQVVEMAVANFYRVDLAAFHKALVGHVLAKYRQR